MEIDPDDVVVEPVETVVDTDSEDEDDSILVDTCCMESQPTLYAGKSDNTNYIVNKSNGKRGPSKSESTANNNGQKLRNGKRGPSKSKSTANNHGQKLRNGERGPSKSESTANNHRQKLRRSHNYKGM